jgi:hypothetical protein
MYKAIHAQTGQEMIILAPFWLRQIERLREMDRADLLLCQGCRQPMRVKAGEQKRAHFAHKHLQACSYGTESPDILAARAELYLWLFRQFGDRVNIEMAVPGASLPRPVDCWVEREGGSFAYWIIEAGIKLEPRENIKATMEKVGARLTVVFLSSMLNEEKKMFQSVLLTPTERAFMKPTAFDEALAGLGEVGQSLHYLDAEGQTLTTYHDLRLHHRPNWYKGMKKTSRLDEVRASMLTGDPIHPGELDRIRRDQSKKLRMGQKQKAFQEREAERVEKTHPPQPRGWGIDPQVLESKRQGPIELPCQLCGQVTADYWYSFTSEDGHRMCRCRDCLSREEI